MLRLIVDPFLEVVKPIHKFRREIKNERLKKYKRSSILKNERERERKRERERCVEKEQIRSK